MDMERDMTKLRRWRYFLILAGLAIFIGATTLAFAGLPKAAAPSKAPTKQQIALPRTSGSKSGQGPRTSIALPQKPGGQIPFPPVLRGKMGANNAPNEVLYDQYNSLSIGASTSQNFEATYDQYDSQAADDFFVAGGQTWLVNEVDVAGAYAGNGRADSVNVIFYASAGNLPGAPVYTATDIVPASGLQTGDFAILLDQPAMLTVGTYWVSVQANERLNPNGQWFWRNRNAIDFNEAAWRNPGGGFFTPCADWEGRAGNCGIAWDAPDQVFRLVGTLPSTPTPTGTPPTATDTPTDTPTADTGSPTATNTEAATVPIPVTTAVATIIEDTPTPQPACGLIWRVIDSPNPGPFANGLNGISIVSANDIWAVGDYYDENFYEDFLSMHWDGSTWTTVTVPQTYVDGLLTAVAAESSNNVWAVGNASPDGSYGGGVIFHWDGSNWTDVTPAGMPRDSSLSSVAVLSSDDAWAVGDYYDQFGNTTALSLHWNGTTWSIVTVPSSGSIAYLSSVAGSEPNDVWAVGASYDGVYQQPFTLHWDGAQWNIVTSIATGEDAYLYSVSVYAPNDVWAVGTFFYDFYDNATLTLHWDGNSWSYVASPEPDQDSAFYSVDMLGPGDVWATGESTYDDGTNYVQHTLTAHWDGSEWTQVFAPNPTGSNLASVAATAPDDVWSVGIIGSYSPGTTLVERYYDPCATPTATVTGTPPTATATRTRIPSPTVTNTSPPTSTPTPTVPPGPSCPDGFADVAPNDPNFGHDHCATCAGILDTYACGYSPAEPCIPPNNYPYFRGSEDYVGTRGELSKSVSNAAGFNDPPGGQQLFEDVPVNSTYYTYTYRLAERYIEDGYACGGPGEPCIPPMNLPYYRPATQAVRGEFTRFVSNAAGFSEDHTDQIFEDVPPGAEYYPYVERLASRNLISGYPCGGPGEPCVPPLDLPYFRPYNDLDTLARQTFAHILVDTFLPGCPLITPTPMPTAPPSSTSTPTSVPSYTPTRTSTSVATTPVATRTPQGSTETPTRASNTSTPTAQATSCTLQFSDVPVGSTFYAYIRCLACKGIINGYPSGAFKPNNDVTRGQLSKIVSNSAGFDDTPVGQQYEDVPIGSTFYVYIYRLSSKGYINGYLCGQTPTEPCGPAQLPYFRPNSNATRGQISKIVSNAAGYVDVPAGQQFQDVPIGSTYYPYTYRLTSRNIMQGYPCGGQGEPCIGPGNLPYFRPNNNATRGQTSKIDAGAFFPDCSVLSAK